MASINLKKYASTLASSPNPLGAGSITKSTFANPPKPQAQSVGTAASPKNNFIASNIGATNTAPTTITPPKTQSNLPSSGQQFVASLVNTPATPSANTGITPPKESSTTPQTPKPSTESAYTSYLKTLFNPKQAEIAQKNAQLLNERTARELQRSRKKEDELRNNEIGQVERGQSYRLAENERLSNKSLADLAIAKGYNTDIISQMTNAGKSLYDVEQPIKIGDSLYQKQEDGSYKQIIAPASESFTLGKDQVRYDAQGNVIAGGGTSDTGSGSYVTGANPTADAWVKYVQGGGKIGDVPDEYRNIVAQGISTTPKAQSELSKNVVTVIDELLGNSALSRISGPADQLLGGFFGDAALAKNKFDQLKSLLSLDNIKYLKGTGAISDAEQRLLANAATAIGRNLSDKDFKTELTKLKQSLGAVADNAISADERDFLKSQGYTDEQIKELDPSFSTVGKTTASIPKTSRLAYVNNNPGNLRFARQPGAVKGEKGFAKFPTVEAGVRALEKQIKLDASRGLTIAQFVDKYAPPNENDTMKYIRDIVEYTGKSPFTPIASIDPRILTKAVAMKESNTQIA